MTNSIPSTLRGVVLKSYQEGARSLVLEELPIPVLVAGEVLVKISATPINPSDLVFLRGQYGIHKKLPVVAGFEGSGTVLSSGPGLLGRWLIGKRVACHAPENGHGTWADYMVASVDHCIPLRRHVTDEQGATLMVNPLTASVMMDQILRSGVPAFIQTAAASALGQMIVRRSISLKIPAIHVVRRPDQVSLLRGLGAEHVLDSSHREFDRQLQSAARQFNARVALDAVGGSLTDRLAAAMPVGSRIIVYGALSGEACQINPGQLIFKDQHLEGFWLTEWMKTKNWLQKLRLATQVQSCLGTDLQTQIQQRFPLDRFREAMDLYKLHRTDGKVLLMPSSLSQVPRIS